MKVAQIKLVIQATVAACKIGSFVFLTTFADAAESNFTERDTNAAHSFSQKYFYDYYKENGADLRLEAVLIACDLEGMAKEVSRGLPDLMDFVARRIRDEPAVGTYDSSRGEVAWISLLSTKTLIEGYKLGYLDAMMKQFSKPQDCTGIPKVYEEYLRRKREGTR